ncbi:ribonuclease T [Halomonas sp. CnH100-B]|jgi:ribonuclease T|uniref:Ribonuclease T n=1 Tax=Vreelandella aquamarina TaxID=77097 RepID=A0A857GN89_9GAMM|nr:MULTISPECIES: ribonuclease T [Halomonas]MAO61934.1 ribonuclease T [Halomonas sp.]MAO63169.1 ribonuclease T [Halomonas sp.]MCO7228082.1 ribonuclease T [Halomonas sp. CnH100-B]MDK9687152.1 ribonuclease T [Halomonas sp. LC1]MDP4556600.1 ribonuclease T [Halomonas meridiana]|tara:strand:- start:694 stop:1365 length:672 start_codon:yes stop_codon:yes gene_type:complete
MSEAIARELMAQRFRSYLPVVIDLETGGFNAQTDAVLEIAAVTLTMDPDGNLLPDATYAYHIHPFEGANVEQSALDFTGINLDDPLRRQVALSEAEALGEIFRPIRKSLKAHGCSRAILVGHNAAFDHGFLNAAANRCNVKRNPFHPFSSFDTATLAGFVYGQTVLARACRAAGIEFDNKAAHSARYDTERTAELFCAMVNRYKDLGGWRLAQREQALDGGDE